MIVDVAEVAREVLARHSKSFALAARLLPPAVRDDVAVLYAWCRRADDAVDRAPHAERAPALARLRRELAHAYEGAAIGEPIVDAFGDLARGRGIPREYAEALLDGLAMDVEGARYHTLDELLLYCFRVAGVVGLMICHVVGLRDARALRHAVHLGLAMQLTNVCRDVAEDAADGRIYLPRALLSVDGDAALLADRASLGPRIRVAVLALLDRADAFYASADRGLVALPFRVALAVRAARSIYAAIGDVLRRREGDPFLGRAVVSSGRKAWLLVRAVVASLSELPARLSRAFTPVPLPTVSFPDDVLPL